MVAVVPSVAEGEVVATEEAGTGEVREAGAMVLAMVGPRGAAVRAVVWVAMGGVDGGWGGDGGGEGGSSSLREALHLRGRQALEDPLLVHRVRHAHL